MDKNGTEPETYKRRSIFLMKALLLVLCVVVVAQFALFAKNFASLKALNNRLNALEEERILDSKSLRINPHEHGPRRSKRGTEETDIKKTMIKLEKLEGR
jgi:biopolymer transport protein ExbB/TolQ